MIDFFRNMFHAISNVLLSIGIIDIIDILLLSYLMYAVLKLIRETRAGQLMKGVMVLGIAYLVSDAVGLKSISFITEKTLSVGLLAIIILFQPELRRALEKFGRNAFRVNLFSEDRAEANWNYAIPIICESVTALSETNTGALIVIERSTKLGEQLSSGTILNAKPSPQLFGNIFYPKTPLHDGAVIMRSGMILAAACFLPRPQKDEFIDKALGTRHRAAIGMSENSDAIVIVVSEETGQISVAENGVLTRNYTADSLEQLLRNALIPIEDDHWRNKTGKLPFFRFKSEESSNKKSAAESTAPSNKEVES